MEAKSSKWLVCGKRCQRCKFHLQVLFLCIADNCCGCCCVVLRCCDVVLCCAVVLRCVVVDAVVAVLLLSSLPLLSPPSLFTQRLSHPQRVHQLLPLAQPQPQPSPTTRARGVMRVCVLCPSYEDSTSVFKGIDPACDPSIQGCVGILETLRAVGGCGGGQQPLPTRHSLISGVPIF